jgi:ABC-type oligopeptide transport system ATPase subunit
MDNLVSIRDLKMHFPIRSGLLRRVVGYVKAVDGVSFDIPRGKTVGLVGESGCGKTTTGRTLVGLYRATAGSVDFDGQNLTELKNREIIKLRRRFQMVFQDPYGSLNPRIPVGDIIAEGLDIHKLYETREERKAVVESLMDKTGLDPAFINRYSHEFSGGQRQRIGIARALALNPELLVLDEPVSALDVSIQVQILELLNNLKRDMGLTYLFIAYDLPVVEYFSDYVAVMYQGKIVELADRASLYAEKDYPGR